ncbi:MAG: protein kinase domain-containing protein [Myxococcota bacterium]
MEQLGKYQLIRKIATGGMAEVFLARTAGPMGFEKKLVLKRILPHLADDPQFVQMFLAEAKIAALLDHPNVVQIFDFGQEGRHFFIAMEHIDGPNLRHLARMARDVDTPLPFAVCAKLVSHACEGLSFAHDFKDPETGQPMNLIHRDISPDNILVSRTGAVKVVDFGIAKASTQPHLTKSGVIKGKLMYMPPEQMGRGAMDRRVDVFALGMVLYELISGLTPFDTTSEVSIIQAIMSPEPLPPVTFRRADVPFELVRIVSRAMEKDREQRYGSCKEMQADLERFLASTGQSVQPHQLAEWVEKLEALAPPDAYPTPVAQAVFGVAEAVPGHTDVSAVDSEGFADTKVSTSGKTPPEPRRPEAAPPSNATPFPPVEEKASVAPASFTTDAMARAGVKKSRLPLAAVASGILGVVVTGYALTRSEPPPLSPPVAQALPVPVPEPSPEPQPSPLPTPAPQPAPPKPRVKPAPKAARNGSLEFRVRPYATVYLNGELLGDTPLQPMNVPAGKHSIRLVNAKLGKDVEVDFTVKANDKNLFKYNLRE